MRLAVLNITAGGVSGGYRKYLANVLPRISSRSYVEKTICVLPSSVTINGIAESCTNTEFIKITPYQISNLKSHSEIKTILDQFRPDVVYIPVERPFSYEKAPVVNMLQNMEPFVRPFSGNPPTEKIKNWLRLHIARKALKNADRIIAISNFVKEYLVNQLHIDSQKIGLVYHGVDKAIDVPKRPIVIPETCRDFLFTSGSIRPARGLEDILKAVRDLATRNFKNPLVIAGSTDPVMTDYQKKLIKWVDKNNLSENVIWAGQFNEKEMAWCYQNCSAFIMTSRVESFGQIAVEAMANGCLCISANNPCFPEIIEDAAIYYTPGNGGELCEAIKAVLSWDQPKKIMVSEKAKWRASQFSWDVCAEKTIEEFKRATQTFNVGGGTRRK